MKMVAFNICNWLKQANMPVDASHHEKSIPRRLFFRVSISICDNGDCRHINFTTNEKLKRFIAFINNALINSSNKLCITFRNRESKYIHHS
jgi:hypothetical protein